MNDDTLELAVREMHKAAAEMKRAGANLSEAKATFGSKLPKEMGDWLHAESQRTKAKWERLRETVREIHAKRTSASNEQVAD